LVINSVHLQCKLSYLPRRRAYITMIGLYLFSQYHPPTFSILNILFDSEDSDDLRIAPSTFVERYGEICADRRVTDRLTDRRTYISKLYLILR
jgi:hypothetical protein